MTEILIKYARVDPEKIAIYTGDGQPLDAKWAAISHIRAEPSDTDINTNYERFALYLLDASGVHLEYLPWDTLEIAIDQAGSIVGVADWVECSIELDSSWAEPGLPWSS